jgi:hypothetical protein
VLHLAAAEQDGDLDLVVVLQELARLGDLGVHVVVTRFGADADLLEFLLADLAGLVALLRVLVPQLGFLSQGPGRFSMY